MNFKIYAAKSVDTIVAEFNSSLTHGLSAQDVASKLKQYGTNQAHERAIMWWDILAHQVWSLFFMLFCVIALLFILLGQWLNAGIILLLITINVTIGFYQEYKASKTIKLLRSYIKKMATVLRDGKKETVPVADLVPGDIVYLKEGDIVPADLRIIQEKGLLIDESILTGESVSIKKRADVTSSAIDMFNAYTIAFAGTAVEQGSATGIVFATGNSSIFGSLVKSSSYHAWHESAIEKGVIQLSKFIIVLSAITLVCMIVGNIAIKGYANINIIHLLIFAIALMVSIIPEALPIIVIFNLSLGVRRLIAMGVVVKRLSALEDLGAVQLLCIDKTGTLTERQQQLIEPVGPDISSLLLYSGISLLPHMTKQTGFEGAIENYIMAHDPSLISRIPADYTYIDSIPFDPEHRRVIVQIQDKKSLEYLSVVRGSFDNVAAMCSAGQNDFKEQVYQQNTQGNPVLVVAIKKLAQKSDNLAENDQGYTMIGVLPFQDPIKSTAPEVLAQAKKLGIEIKVISGDAPEVCAAIGMKLDLIKDPASVVTGAMLEAASPADKERLVREGIIFARILPDQKAEIIQIAKKYKTVGYMGDGLNDLPAIETADVALVVQGCPDVVREAGDIILQQKSLLAVVQGITEGRIVLANTMKYIKTALSTNFGNFYTIAICSLFITDLPMLPIQLLLLNLLSDFPMITLATDTVDAQALATPQQYTIKSIVAIAIILGIVSSIFDFMIFGYFFHKPEAVMQTGWFVESILTEIVFIFSIRTQQIFYRASRPSLPLLFFAASAIAAVFLLVYSSIGQRLFQFVWLPYSSLLFIVLLVIAYFVATEIVKYAYYKKLGK